MCAPKQKKQISNLTNDKYMCYIIIKVRKIDCLLDSFLTVLAKLLKSNDFSADFMGYEGGYRSS
jgi:hypothetical protein